MIHLQALAAEFEDEVDVDVLVNALPSVLSRSLPSLRSKIVRICGALPSCTRSGLLAKPDFLSYSADLVILPRIRRVQLLFRKPLPSSGKVKQRSPPSSRSESSAGQITTVPSTDINVNAGMEQEDSAYSTLALARKIAASWDEEERRNMLSLLDEESSSISNVDGSSSEEAEEEDTLTEMNINSTDSATELVEDTAKVLSKKEEPALDVTRIVMANSISFLRTFPQFLHALRAWIKV